MIPFLFYKYGEKIRIRSKFAPATAPSAAHDEEKAEQSTSPNGRATEAESKEQDVKSYTMSRLEETYQRISSTQR